MAKKKRGKKIIAAVIIIAAVAAAAVGAYGFRDYLPFGDKITAVAENISERINALSSPSEVIKCYERAINDNDPARMIRVYPKAVRDAYDSSAVLRTRLESAMDLGIDGVSEVSIKITGKRELTDTELAGLTEYAKSLAQDERITKLGIDAAALADFTQGYVLECDYGDGDTDEITVVREADGWCISPKTAFGAD